MIARRASATAGIVGPVLFTVGVLAQELARRDGYSPIRQEISELEAGPYGWAQQLNFAVFGLLLLGFAVGLHRGVRPTRTGTIAAWILGWNGVGLALAAVFPLRDNGSGGIYDRAGLHHLNGAIFFLSIWVAMILLSRRLTADPAWRNLAAYVLWTGIALLLLDVLSGPLQRIPAISLQAWSGIVQRATLAVWFPCLIVLSLRLRKVESTYEQYQQP